MSSPTTLAPWYVVFKVHNGELIYFQSDYSDDIDEETGRPYTFSPNERGALIYHSLASAKRVAAAEGAMVRVLLTEDDAKEFERA